MHSIPFDGPALEPMLPPPPLGRAVVIGANGGAAQRFPRLESSSSSGFVSSHHHHHHHTMPPQPGVFALPYSANSHIHHNNHKQLMPHRHHDPHNGMPPPAMLPDDMNSKHRKKKPSRPGRYYSETSAALHGTAHQIATDPSSNPHFALRLYPISLERSARLTQISFDEDSTMAAIALAYEEEKERIEKEWKIGREKVREKLLEGVEERRRRAKEERDSETIIGDGNGDSQSRPHITRKLRNQLGSSPPPSHGPGGATLGITTANSNSLQVEEIPSPFPLALTSLPTPGMTGTGATGRKKGKGGAAQAQTSQTLGKAVLQLAPMRDGEVESDLGEIRRGAKRKRAQMK